MKSKGIAFADDKHLEGITFEHIEEIDRRIQRKKNALGMVSNWLCIALIAREQGLEMSSIVDALSIN